MAELFWAESATLEGQQGHEKSYGFCLLKLAFLTHVVYLAQSRPLQLNINCYIKKTTFHVAVHASGQLRHHNVVKTSVTQLAITLCATCLFKITCTTVSSVTHNYKDNLKTYLLSRTVHSFLSIYDMDNKKLGRGHGIHKKWDHVN